MMTKAEILEYVKANGDCYVATVEEDKPRVRGMSIYKVDERGIIFQTWKTKDIFGQLQKNPNVELCFRDPKGGRQLRISGQMELLEDLALKKQVVADRTFMKKTVDAKGWDVVAMYRVKNAKAFWWTGATNFDPKTYTDLT
jgi:pyridoxamine 5'-phosphate oxidase